MWNYIVAFYFYDHIKRIDAGSVYGTAGIYYLLYAVSFQFDTLILTL